MSSRFFQGPKGSFVIIDYIVSLLAIPCNCIILESLLRSQFSLTGYKRFLISLTISDLYICVVNLLTFLYQALTSYTSNAQIEKCGADILRSLMFVGFFANLFNLCGMSVDHLIGILYPLRYRYLINGRVAKTAVVLIWVLSIMLGFADFPVITLVYLQRHYGTVGSSVGAEMWPGRNMTIMGPAALLQLLGVQTTMEPIETDEYEYDDSDAMSADYMNAGNDTIEKTTVSPVVDDFFPADFPEPTGVPPTINNGDTFRCILPADIETLFRSIMSENGSLNSLENTSLTKNGLEILKGIKCSNENLDWCTFYLVNNYWQEIGVISLTLIGAVFLVICYGRIFKKVFVNIDPSRRSLRKLVMTTFLLLGTFTFCWLPFMIFEFGMLLLLHSNNDIVKSQSFMSSTSLFVIHNCLNTILICYPLIDPLIYYSRVPLVQRYLLCRYFRHIPCVRDYLERSSLRRSYAIGKSSLGRAAFLREASHRPESFAGNTAMTEGIQLTIPSIVIEHPDEDETPAPSPVDGTIFPESQFPLPPPKRSSIRRSSGGVASKVRRQYGDRKLSAIDFDDMHMAESYDQLVHMNSEILPLSLYPPLPKRSSISPKSSSPKAYKRKFSVTLSMLSRRTSGGDSGEKHPAKTSKAITEMSSRTTCSSFPNLGAKNNTSSLSEEPE